jgi:PPOX class probable F420-dependent enzyme
MIPFDPATPEGKHALERLGTERMAWLSTVTPQGQPQTFPIWFLWEDGEILVYSAHSARRNANIVANPRVSLHLPDDGEGGDVVIVEGEARIDAGTPPVTDHAVYRAKYEAWMDSQLGGVERMAAVYNVPIRIAPTRGVTFGG